MVERKPLTREQLVKIAKASARRFKKNGRISGIEAETSTVRFVDGEPVFTPWIPPEPTTVEHLDPLDVYFEFGPDGKITKAVVRDR